MESLRRHQLPVSRRTLLGAATALAAAGVVRPAFAQSPADAPAAPAEPKPPVAPGLPLRHGLAMHGDPALPPGFEHLPYVRADAPKGGRLTQGVLGGFDTLNPYVYKGVPAQGYRGYVFETLLARSYDEPFSLYGLIAEAIEVPDDRSFVVFHIDPRAKFSDGEPIAVDDVLFSFQLLRDHGHPSFRAYYRRVTGATVEDERAIRFELPAEDRELAMVLGLMPVLPMHATDAVKFEETTFKPMTGSGPYVTSAVDRTRSVTFRRDPNYWGRDLPVNRGLNNFDEVRYDYYRDDTTMFEAFKKGLIDFRAEGDANRWTTGYDFPAVKRGDVKTEGFEPRVPWGMNAFVFNTRKSVFADVRTREALGELFDFEWIDRHIFGEATTRTRSYFDGSELASTALAADDRERELLKPFPGVVREDIMEGRWSPPVSNGSGRDRERLRAALDGLKAAGWTLKDGEMRRENGDPLRFEILVVTKDQERLSLAYAGNLERAGVKATVRLVDSVQSFRRMQTYDFDMIIYNWYSSLSPGLEQRKFWGSRAADSPGERNYMGVRSPAIDAMIDAMIASRERTDFVSAVRALDRVLLSGFYVVPLFHVKERWVARWKRIERPETTPLMGPVYETWWHAPGSDRAG